MKKSRLPFEAPVMGAVPCNGLQVAYTCRSGGCCRSSTERATVECAKLVDARVLLFIRERLRCRRHAMKRGTELQQSVPNASLPRRLPSAKCLMRRIAHSGSGRRCGTEWAIVYHSIKPNGLPER